MKILNSKEAFEAMMAGRRTSPLSGAS